jgi:hypothetical protein
MILALTAAALLATTPLEQAEAACEHDVKACTDRDRLRQEAQAKPAKENQLDRQLREAQAAERRAEKAEQKRTAELKTKCGADYNRVRVGMTLDRVQECTGPLRLKLEDATGAVYRGRGGMIRVESGKVVRVLFN